MEHRHGPRVRTAVPFEAWRGRAYLGRHATRELGDGGVHLARELPGEQRRHRGRRADVEAGEPRALRLGQPRGHDPRQRAGGLREGMVGRVAAGRGRCYH